MATQNSIICPYFSHFSDITVAQKKFQNKTIKHHQEYKSSLEKLNGWLPLNKVKYCKKSYVMYLETTFR